MPELPEVETVRAGLAPAMVGARIAAARTNRPDLRFAFPPHFCARLQGACILALRRRAKFLLADLDSGETLLAHLGMSGRFCALAPGDPPPDTNPAHDHVVLAMSNAHRILYNDPRRFGFMDLIRTRDLGQSRFLAALGPEPLGNAFGAPWLAQCFARSTRPVKAALLDQRVVAGLGNIYVCEALYRAGIHPATKTGRIGSARRERLAAAIRGVLAEAIDAGGSTLRDYAAADGTLGYFQHRFAVYGRAGAPCQRSGCNGVIHRIVQSGRSSFYCPKCQR